MDLSVPDRQGRGGGFPGHERRSFVFFFNISQSDIFANRRNIRPARRGRFRGSIPSQMRFTARDQAVEREYAIPGNGAVLREPAKFPDAGFPKPDGK